MTFTLVLIIGYQKIPFKLYCKMFVKKKEFLIVGQLSVS